jgi:predicted Rossmann-fold nucleotide-binding protein
METAVVQEKAAELGRELAKLNCILVTGACDGVPLMVARAARLAGADVWGFSPSLNLDRHKSETPDDDPSVYTKLIYTPSNFPFSNDITICRKFRNVISTAHTDAGIVISGRWGTLNEFTCLHEMEKIIGILTGTGGISDELPQLVRQINKPSKAQMLFDDDPSSLVKRIFSSLPLNYKN